MKNRQRWLDLAMRQRRWQVDEQLPGLAGSVAAQARAERERDAAGDRVDHAHRERRGLLSGGSFSSEQLALHAAQAVRARAALLAAEDEAARAGEEASRRRAQAQALLAERDAYAQRLEEALARARQEAVRRQLREHDELWLARLRAGEPGSPRED